MARQKKIFLVSLIAVFILPFDLCNQKLDVVYAKEQSKITLRLAHYLPETDLVHKTATLFSTLVEKKTNGKIEIRIYPNNQLGGPQEIAEQVRLGSIDMAINGPGQIYSYVHPVAIVQLPFFWKSRDHIYRFLSGEGGKLLEEVAMNKGFRILNWWEGGFRVFSNNRRPIHVPDDMRGLKFRVPPSKVVEETIRLLGAIPAQINFSELYMALAQGIVDGQENPISTFYTMKFYEKQKYLTIPGQGYMWIPAILSSSARKFQVLPPDIQKMIIDSAREAKDWMMQQVEKENAAIEKALVESGVQIVKVDEKPFAEKVRPVWSGQREFIGADYFEKLLRIADEESQRK